MLNHPEKNTGIILQNVGISAVLIKIINPDNHNYDTLADYLITTKNVVLLHKMQTVITGKCVHGVGTVFS